MKLFGATNKRSFNTLKLRVALAEAAAPYEFIAVDLARGEHRTPAFLAINPHGKIPALLDGDFALAESDAILWYIAEAHPEAGLLPAADGTLAAAQTRARVLQWCDFASTTLYAAYVEWWTPALSDDPARRNPAAAATAANKIARAVAVLQTVLTTRDHLAGPFSIADLSNAAILDTLKRRLPTDPLAPHDRAQAWYTRVTSRPAWQETLAQS